MLIGCDFQGGTTWSGAWPANGPQPLKVSSMATPPTATVLPTKHGARPLQGSGAAIWPRSQEVRITGHSHSSLPRATDSQIPKPVSKAMQPRAPSAQQGLRRRPDL